MLSSPGGVPRVPASGRQPPRQPDVGGVVRVGQPSAGLPTV